MTDDSDSYLLLLDVALSSTSVSTDDANAHNTTTTTTTRPDDRDAAPGAAWEIVWEGRRSTWKEQGNAEGEEAGHAEGYAEEKEP